MVLAAAAVCLSALFAVGCGGKSSNFGASAAGGFSAASFTGRYAILLNGANAQGVLRQGGVLTADGMGNITNGTMDVAQGGGVTSLSFDGTYTLNANGTGVATLSLPGGHVRLALALATPATVFAIEDDEFANVSGVLEQQDAAAFAAAFSGQFVFSLHGLQGPASSAIVGAFTASHGQLRGDQDANLSGVLKTQDPVTGGFSAPDATGRGTLHFTDATGATSSFFYYVVNGGSFRMLSSDSSGLSGRAERQAGVAFSNAALAGGYAFGSTGDTGVVGGSRTVGRFTADGAGNITAAMSDAVLNGAVATMAGASGAYAIDSTGRGVVDIPAAGSLTRRILRMANPRRALFLVDSSSPIEDGTMDRQPSGPFSNSTLNGQYVLVLGGSGPNGLVDRLGLLQAGGQGSLTFSGILNMAGQISQPPSLTGTYAITAGGRCAANVGNLSPNLLLYLFSSTQAYALQADDQTQVSGSLQRQ